MPATDVEACTQVLEECKALLEVLAKLSVTNDKRTAEDFVMENSEGKYKSPCISQIQEPFSHGICT